MGKKVTKKQRLRKFILLSVGFLLILGACGLSLWNSWEDRTVAKETEQVKKIMQSMPPEFDYEELAGSLEEGLEAAPDYQLDSAMEMPTVQIGDDRYVGTIIIPDLNINLPVISCWNYDLLKKAPCLYRGSIYAGDAIIMAHNYKIHFRGLWNAQVGMHVQFIDVDGNTFNYAVTQIEDIPTDNLDDLLKEDPEWDLTLFTCSYGGNSRVTLRCNQTDGQN